MQRLSILRKRKRATGYADRTSARDTVKKIQFIAEMRLNEESYRTRINCKNNKWGE